MPYLGNDGFSDCDKLCDPDKGYPSSCARICPGYTTISQKTTTLAPPSSTPDIDKAMPVWNNEHIILIGALIVAVVGVLVLICCYRAKITAWWRNWRQDVKQPVQEQDISPSSTMVASSSTDTMNIQPAVSDSTNNQHSELDKLIDYQSDNTLDRDASGGLEPLQRTSAVMIENEIASMITDNRTDIDSEDYVNIRQRPIKIDVRDENNDEVSYTDSGTEIEYPLDSAASDGTSSETDCDSGTDMDRAADNCRQTQPLVTIDIY